jgi:protein SCO1
MKNTPLQFGLIALIIALSATLVWALWWSPTPTPKAHKIYHPDLATPPPGGDFTLEGVHGTVRLQDLRGKVVLIYFGYTLCPDICPTNLAGIARALEALSAEERARTQGIFISVDPERDTLENLAQYVHFFHPEMLGVTGSAEVLAHTAALYGAAYQKVATDSALGYMIDQLRQTCPRNEN